MRLASVWIVALANRVPDFGPEVTQDFLLPLPLHLQRVRLRCYVPE
jgi:hypothetical protein